MNVVNGSRSSFSQLFFGDGRQKRRSKHGGGRNNRLLQRNMVPVSLAHLRFDHRIVEVEVPEVLKLSDISVERAIVGLPNQLRAIHSVVRPLEREIVGPAQKLLCRGAQLEDSVAVERRIIS